jgi:hypothetical protein
MKIKLSELKRIIQEEISVSPRVAKAVTAKRPDARFRIGDPQAKERDAEYGYDYDDDPDELERAEEAEWELKTENEALMSPEDGNVTIELDVVDDEEAGPLEDFLNVAVSMGVTPNVISMSGPGGGWPQVEFTGQKDNVVRFLVKGYGLSPEDAEYAADNGGAY